MGEKKEIRREREKERKREKGREGKREGVRKRERRREEREREKVGSERPVQIGAPPWRNMQPVDEQEVRQVCSDRHETCSLLFQLFEIYNLVY